MTRLDGLQEALGRDVELAGAVVEEQVGLVMERTSKLEEGMQRQGNRWQDEMQKQGTRLQDLVGAVADLGHGVVATLAMFHRSSLRVRDAIGDSVGEFA